MRAEWGADSGWRLPRIIESCLVENLVSLP